MERVPPSNYNPNLNYLIRRPPNVSSNIFKGFGPFPNSLPINQSQYAPTPNKVTRFSLYNTPIPNDVFLNTRGYNNNGFGNNFIVPDNNRLDINADIHSSMNFGNSRMNNSYDQYRQSEYPIQSSSTHYPSYTQQQQPHPGPINSNTSGFGFVKRFPPNVVPSENSHAGEEILNDEEFSEKLIAYARYNRNVGLIKEILSETMIPDSCYSHVVSASRLEALQVQVRALEDHHKKLDEEVKEVEKKCSERKRRFIESTNDFHTNYEKLCKPAVGMKTYNELFNKYYNYWKEEAERKQWEQTLAWAQQTASASTTSAYHHNPALAEILGFSVSSSSNNEIDNTNTLPELQLDDFPIS